MKTLLVNIFGTSGAENVQGEVQMELDLFANEKLKARGQVAGIASGEEDEIVVFEGVENGKYVVLMDPLDGSSNIDVNVSVSTIFSIYLLITPVGTPVTEEEDFLQPGNKQVAAGYVIYVVYGFSTMLVYTTGCGVHAFTYNPSLGVFCLSHESVRFPATGQMYSINEGSYIEFLNGNTSNTARRWTKPPTVPIPRAIHRFAGFRFPSQFTQRRYLSLSQHRDPHPNGKLRLAYECNPIIFLAEQAGGKASYGKNCILDIEPHELHQRSAFFTGTESMVDDVERFIRTITQITFKPGSTPAGHRGMSRRATLRPRHGPDGRHVGRRNSVSLSADAQRTAVENRLY